VLNSFLFLPEPCFSPGDGPHPLTAFVFFAGGVNMVFFLTVFVATGFKDVFFQFTRSKILQITFLYVNFMAYAELKIFLLTCFGVGH
jgi:hypothetical protein